MLIKSDAFKNGGHILARYTCDGENIRPRFEFFDIPINTVSLAIIVDDPDSPTGVWNHWTAWNIDPKTHALREGQEVDWNEGITSFGDIGYGGPCPGSGAHRYIFTLYALDTKLSTTQGATKKELLTAMDGHVLEKAEVMGTYERRK